MYKMVECIESIKGIDQLIKYGRYRKWYTIKDVYQKDLRELFKLCRMHDLGQINVGYQPVLYKVFDYLNETYIYDRFTDEISKVNE